MRKRVLKYDALETGSEPVSFFSAFYGKQKYNDKIILYEK